MQQMWWRCLRWPSNLVLRYACIHVFYMELSLPLMDQSPEVILYGIVLTTCGLITQGYSIRTLQLDLEIIFTCEVTIKWINLRIPPIWVYWQHSSGAALPLIFCTHVHSGRIIYLAKRIIRWWYCTCKEDENDICDGLYM